MGHEQRPAARLGEADDFSLLTKHPFDPASMSGFWNGSERRFWQLGRYGMFDHLRPTTLSGIKTLASNLKAAEGLVHAKALDKASVQAGYQNWGHALNALRDGPHRSQVPLRYEVLVEASWRDRDTRQRGRERMTAALSRPITGLLTPTQIRAGHYLAAYRIVGGGLVDDRQSDSQDRARQDVRRIIRTLQFIDATGLVPSSGHTRAYPSGDDYNDRRPPGADHTHGWYHAATRSYVMVDEPYAPAVPRHEPGRLSWEDQRALLGFTT